MFFQRSIFTALLEWKASAKRKPLVLQGARQTGKTALLKRFGQSEFQDLAYFNFEEQPDLRELFENTRDPKRILQNLSIVHGRSIQHDTTLLVFDEIQECYPALNTLKYFQEQAPEYHLASAGSLLGVALGKEGSFPVGKVDFLEVLPLTFPEFLRKANSELADYLDQLATLEPIPAIFFNQLVEQLKQYFICGGMPEAATTLVQEQDVSKTSQVLRAILHAYALDFSKHTSPTEVARINYVWNSIPGQLARENKKFLYQAVRSGARAREYESAIIWLRQAGLVHQLYQSSKAHLPLAAYDNLTAFKLYLLDVGLLRQKANLDPSVIVHGNRLFTEFKGALAENFVLQSLQSQFDATPRYWTSAGGAEIDFLIQYKNEIIPVEVKSDENIKSRSLAAFHKKYQPPVRVRFSLRNLEMRDRLLSVPLFLAGHLRPLLDKILNE